MKKLLLAAALTGALLVPAKADTLTKIGTMECTVDGGIGLIIGSKKTITCQFGDETYVGSVKKLGIDLGFTFQQKMVWGVYAPSTVEVNSLAGTYLGASAEVTVGLGVGANALLGGSNDSIALQPLSVEGQTGLNISLTGTQLELVKSN